MLDTLRRFKASIFRTLGHPVRVGIVEYLRYGEQSVERLCEKLAEKVAVDEATLTPHLEALRKTARITSREQGGRQACAVRDEALVKVLQTMKDYYFSHLTEAMRLLREEEELLCDKEG